MKRLGFFLIILSIFTACEMGSKDIKNPYSLLPTETSSVIKINALNDFVLGFSNQEILSGIYKKELNATSPILKNLNTNQPVYISFLGNNNTDYVVLTKNDSTLFNLDSLPNHISETLKDFHIQKTRIDSIVFYHKNIGEVFATSNNLETLKALKVNDNSNNPFIKLLETTEDKSVASIVFKNNVSNYSKLLFSKFKNGPNNLVLDLNFSNNNLNYNGIITLNDSIVTKMDCFKNTIPQKTNTISIAPISTNTLLSITYDDFSIFQSNLNKLNQIINDSTQTFLNFTDEIATIDNALILHSLDAQLILESIDNKSLNETYREVDIYKFGNPDFFKTRLQPFVAFENANYFSVYEDYVIFSSSIDNLRAIISDVLNNNTIAKSPSYRNLDEELSNEASLFIYKNSEGLSQIMDKSIKGYNANAVQFIAEDNYAHINGVIKKSKKRTISNSVTEAFSTTVDAKIISTPQTVKNHINNTHDIVLQDVDNVLYLISNSGNVLWKKRLQGKILGKIQQMDMYKNGRLQLVFATAKRLYVLDRNGNDVSPFPLKFNDEITQPLSVFDYDKRKNYRLLVTQGKNLLMYDAKGKSVNGFKYKSNGSEITTQPKHFRIGNKDYIVFTAGQSLKILNRQGKVRIDVKDKIRFSDNAIFLYKNKFTTTNTLGQLVQVDTKGKSTTKNLNLTDKHHIETTSKTLVTMNENKLKIRSKTLNLDYGDYTVPKIFYLRDKIYVTTTDLQSNKVYLFDSQAQSISNFPVFGTSAAELQQLDNKKGLELITQSGEKTIVIYRLH